MKMELPAFLPEELRASASRISLNGGQTLFSKSDRVEYVYYVLQGELIAIRHMPNGKEAVMQRARGREFFALSAIAVDNHAFGARSVACAEVVRLPVDCLKELLVRDGQFAMAFAAQVADDHRRQCTRVERLLIPLARDRILHFLVCEGNLEDRRFRVVDLARDLGIDPCTVSRTITELRVAGEVLGQGRQLRLTPECREGGNEAREQAFEQDIQALQMQ